MKPWAYLYTKASNKNNDNNGLEPAFSIPNVSPEHSLPSFHHPVFGAIGRKSRAVPWQLRKLQENHQTGHIPQEGGEWGRLVGGKAFVGTVSSTRVPISQPQLPLPWGTTPQTRNPTPSALWLLISLRHYSFDNFPHSESHLPKAKSQY